MAWRSDPDASQFELLHPVYLDTSMLISFLATLDDGISFSSEVAEKQADGKKSDIQAEASGKLPSLASILGLEFGASGKYARSKTADNSTESKFVKQHTAASLFNRLRTRLIQDEAIAQLDVTTNLSVINPGAIVEIRGKFDEAPLKKMVDLFASIWPFVEGQAIPTLPELSPDELEALTPTQTQQRQAVEAATRQLDENRKLKEIVDLVGSDLDRSPIVDLILRANNVSVLVTTSREFLSDDVTASLVGGTFAMLGKVTAVESRPDAETLVVRRGAMGAIAESAVLPMLEQFANHGAANGLNFDLPHGKLRSPYMQVIPLAIFV